MGAEVISFDFIGAVAWWTLCSRVEAQLVIGSASGKGQQSEQFGAEWFQQTGKWKTVQRIPVGRANKQSVPHAILFHPSFKSFAPRFREHIQALESLKLGQLYEMKWLSNQSFGEREVTLLGCCDRSTGCKLILVTPFQVH